MPKRIEGEGTKPVFLRLPADLHKVLSAKAKKRKVTIQKQIIATLDERTMK